MIDEISRRLGLDPDWREHGTCRQMDASWWFPEPGQNHHVEAARSVCRTSCPVSASCLAWAMAYEEGLSRDRRHGIYGGFTGPERYRMERDAEESKRYFEAVA